MGYLDGAESIFLNAKWVTFTGWWMTAEATTMGLFYCIAIIVIPFGKQNFKIAKLALMPFGTTIG